MRLLQHQLVHQGPRATDSQHIAAQRHLVIDVTPSRTGLMIGVVAALVVAGSGAVFALAGSMQRDAMRAQPSAPPPLEPARLQGPTPEPDTAIPLAEVGSPPPGSGGIKGHAPQVRGGAITVNGRLDPAIIERVVRQTFGRLRMCYERGLKRKPTLEGRVTVSFVIGRDGSIMSTRSSESSLTDNETVSCVVAAFAGIQFPAPAGGIVTVAYPVMFSLG